MELKAGFKQTDVGEIPDDWEVIELKDLSEKIMVGIASSATHAYRDNGVVLFRNQNIKPNYLDDTDILFIRPEYESLFKNKRLKTDDLLTARTGYPGTTCKVPSKYEGAQSFTTLITRIKNDSIDINFLSYYLNSEKGKLFFELNQIGGGQKNVNAGTLKFMPIPLPPTKAEQTAIATALGDMDNLINGLAQIIEKKKAIKQGAMQELLKPKEGWVVKSFGELFEITSSKRVFQSEWKTSGVPFYRARELALLGENGVIDNELFITPEMYQQFKSLYGIPQKGDLLVTGVGTLGKVYAVIEGHEFYFKDGNIIWFKINNTINTEYLKQLFATKLITKQIEDASAGTTVGTYTITGAKKTIIPLPSRHEQDKISDILSDMDNGISSLQQNLSKYKSMKQGMMQELLTGKIRLV